MTIDVILPAYEGLDTIDKAIASVVMQTLDEGDRAKITIVNDCSPHSEAYDGITARWKEIADLELITREENGGAGAARQTGIDATDGDAIAFLDIDDVYGSPFALRALAREIKRGRDIAMGLFIEETPFGIVEHGENYVWCHGKMYSRDFIAANNIRFNDTRYNEDVYFNAVCKALTDRTSYIPQVVYIWQNNRASTVRRDDTGYKYGFGWYAFIDNMTLAVKEMEAKHVNAGRIAMFVCSVLVRLYWNLNEAIANLPDSAETAIGRCMQFYDEAARTYVETGTIDYGDLSQYYLTIAKNEAPEIIPVFTFDSFLEKLGYFNDTERHYDNGAGSI